MSLIVLPASQRCSLCAAGRAPEEAIDILERSAGPLQPARSRQALGCSPSNEPAGGVLADKMPQLRTPARSKRSPATPKSP